MREWSTHQIAAFDAVKHLRDQPSGALVIEAGPGSGKTTTCLEMLKLLYPQQRGITLAFNKHTADKLKESLGGMTNISAATINSYGWQAVRSAWKGCEMDQNGNKTLIAMREHVADPDLRRAWGGPMKRLIALKKATLYSEKTHGPNPDGDCASGTCQCATRLASLSAHEIATRYDLDLPTDAEFMQVAEMVWKKVCNQTSLIDFDDQWFMPILKKLPVPTYDFAFIDEAQDLSSTQVELLTKIAPRIVAIGDPRQSIYGFRGADPDAMEKLTARLKAKVLPLSVCYRCPKAVIEKANQVLKDWDEEHGSVTPLIIPAPNAEEGTVDQVSIKHLRGECRPGSWILSRTTAPLIKECLKFIVEGVKATVKGRDIGQSLVSLIDKVGGHDIVDFIQRLDNYHAAERARLEAAGREAQMQSLEDKVESLHALSEGARTVQDVEIRIANVFSDDKSTGVTFATAHRSKGLEADDIYILCPENMPMAKAKTEWAKKQERNLQYVAFTRAMKRLRLVVGTT